MFRRTNERTISVSTFEDTINAVTHVGKGGFGYLESVNMSAGLPHDFVKPGSEWVGLVDRGCLIYPKRDMVRTSQSCWRYISILCIHSVQIFLDNLRSFTAATGAADWLDRQDWQQVPSISSPNCSYVFSLCPVANNRSTR